MKKTILSIALLLACSLLQVSAQNRSVAPRQSEQNQKSSVLAVNHSIRLQGVLPDGGAVDVSTTGIGPKFMANVPLNQGARSLSCGYTLSESEGTYYISYSVSIRIRFQMGETNGQANYQYRDYVLEGKVICNPGSSVVIFKNGEETLSIKLVEEVANSQ